MRCLAHLVQLARFARQVSSTTYKFRVLAANGSSCPAIVIPHHLAHHAQVKGWFSRRRGRILAVKLGYNPNSSSLGVDVTFLLFGMATIAFLTPVVSLFLRGARAKRAAPQPPADA